MFSLRTSNDASRQKYISIQLFKSVISTKRNFLHIYFLHSHDFDIKYDFYANNNFDMFRFVGCCSCCIAGCIVPYYYG
jgi:hypothetical protein